MRRTPQYLLQFFQGGDLYSAASDLDRMTVVDNQLAQLSSIIGNGVLSGWNVSYAGPNEIMVSPGTGFINAVLNKTLSIQTVSVSDDVLTQIWMQSRMFSGTTGLQVETESPASNQASAVYVDLIPPATPTSFVAVAESFNLVNLTWDSNSEPDFDHYRIDRGTGGPFATIASPTVNGTVGTPFQDSAVSPSTTYYYKIYAVDHSGNVSPASPVSSTKTLPDLTLPAEASSLLLFPGNASLSVLWNASPTTGATYKITVDVLNADGSTASTITQATPFLYWQFTGLTNSLTHKVTVQSVSPTNVLSNGIVGTAVPVASVAPLDVLVTPIPSYNVIGFSGLVSSTTPQPHAVLLAWSGNSGVPVGNGAGQKAQYAIRVIANGVASSPITGIGLGTSKSIVSYNAVAAVGIGPQTTLVDNVPYVFRITTLDALGNESAGAYVSGETQNVTPPTDPRSLVLMPGNQTVTVTWTASASSDVIGYALTLNGGTPVIVGNVGNYAFSWLPNGVMATIVVQAMNNAVSGHNLSPGISGTALPYANTTPPAVPGGLRVSPEDSQLSLTWTPNMEPDLAYYIVQRQAVSQSVGALPGKSLTVIDTYQTNADFGTVTVSASTYSFVSANMIGKSYVGYVALFISGNLNGEQSAITAMDPATGTLTFSMYSQFTGIPAAGDQFVIRGTDPSLGTHVMATTETSFLDIGLDDGQTYAYSLAAVDASCNVSPFSVPVLAAPQQGLNDLNSPNNLTANGSVPQKIVLNWQPVVPSPGYSGMQTAFNVYRSENVVIPACSGVSGYFSGYSGANGYDLIASTPPTVLTYTDRGLVNGASYSYVVTAVRDDAVAIPSNGSVIPPNSVLLANVQIDGTHIVTLQNVQTLLAGLNATVSASAEKLILAHRHLTAPNNSVTIPAVELLALVDASTLTPAAWSGLNLSQASIEFYTNVVTNPVTGKPNVYDVGTTYVISPTSLIYNSPALNDFRLLVNGVAPANNPFSIDQAANSVTFTNPLASTDVVSADGSGFNYYIPAELDFEYRGLSVLVNGTVAPNAQVDKDRQTLRFPTQVTSGSSVIVIIDPAIPDFGTEQGARQISLSPNVVLNDFSTTNNTVYTSASGAFDSSDVFFVLVNGSVTSLQNYVDTTNKTITFQAALPAGSTVSLQIINREEVQNKLPANQVIGVDGSSFKTGVFLKPQILPLSHEGRVNEVALPLFADFETQNKYVYSGASGFSGSIGSATTPYSIYMSDTGSILLGSSNGMLQANGFTALLNEGGSSTTTIDYSTNPPGGLAFTSVAPDAIVDAARAAQETSGRVNGNVTLPNGSVILNPALFTLDDGTILICGGFITADSGAQVAVSSAYVYDPTSHVATQVGNMNAARGNHAGAVLPTGNVIVCGGDYSLPQFDAVTGEIFEVDTYRLVSTESYDMASKSWTQLPDMGTARDFHSCFLLDATHFMAAGGNTGGSSSFFPNGEPPYNIPPIPATTTTTEIYDVNLGAWSDAAALNLSRVGADSEVVNGTPIISGGGQSGEEIYQSLIPPSWVLSNGSIATSQNSIANEFGVASIDSPVKQIFSDSSGLVYAVSHASIYVTQDLQTFSKTLGLDAVGVVHRMSQGADGTLYAATDLGIYEIPPDIKQQFTWFQGGLVGDGTTETFDLEPFNDWMLAATEIGVYYSSDQGNAWTQLVALDDVYNVKSVGSVIFANSGQDLYRSNDSGATWTLVATLSFLDSNAKMLGRTPLDLFFGTSTGLYVTSDGVNFSLVAFDQNNDPAANNVHMLDLVGSDVMVGYDNAVYSIDPDYDVLMLAQFAGIVPTVRVNGTEIRNGFTYSDSSSTIYFNVKRLVADTVDMASNYSLYQMVGGGWYSQNANATVLVYDNGSEVGDSLITLNAWLGQVTFTTPLSKTDSVTVTVVGTTISDAGQYLHSELEDKFEQNDVGLPLSLSRDYGGNILQLALGVEHNFIERGLDRNQYYCTNGLPVDRSFASFMENTELYIMGRREFDRFNSTIDYAVQSQQTAIGYASFAPLAALEVGSNLWIGTENSIYVLNPNAAVPFSISSVMTVGLGGSVRDLEYFQGDVLAAMIDGIYSTADGGNTWTKNLGEGLSPSVFAVGSINNVLLAGTDDTVYYSDGINENPPYSIWFRGTYVAAPGSSASSGSSGTSGAVGLYISGTCNSVVVNGGVAYAAIENGLYVSQDGKVWTQAHVFLDKDKNPIPITTMAVFSQQLYVGTGQGLYCDGGTAGTLAGSSANVAVTMSLVTVDPSILASAFAVNDLYVGTNGTNATLYAVGNTYNIYELTSGTWTFETISEAVAIQRFTVVNGTIEVAMATNNVFVE